MKIEDMTPNEIRKLGIEVLSRALGPVGMVRFLQQFDKGSGDYTVDRHEWLDSLGFEDEDIVKEIKANQ